MDFPATHWTMLAQAALSGDTAAGKALEEFCLNYRGPVMTLLRRRGLPEARVEDLVQDFFLQLMKNSSLQRADRETGRFRTWLSGALTKFLADDVKRNHAAKRGGGAAPLSLDAEDALTVRLAADDSGAGLHLDREWALHLMTRALDTAAREWSRGEKAARFAVLRAFLPGATESLTQQEAAARLGLSDTALRSELQRLREAFRNAVRHEVAATVRSPAEVDGELQHLLAVLRASPPLSENSLPQTSATVG